MDVTSRSARVPTPDKRLEGGKPYTFELSLWNSLEELASAVDCGYSVTDPAAQRRQYLAQVSQYPLYLEWFQRIELMFNRLESSVEVLEYGSGPGILAGILCRNPNVMKYVVVEPEDCFLEMTSLEAPRCKAIKLTAEEYSSPSSFDSIVMTAAYHHFKDKLKALRQCYGNLRPGGKIILADVFLPEYSYDTQFNPTNREQFVQAVCDYASAQILAMPKPSVGCVCDQIKTAILDIIRINELKVCLSICHRQLQMSGFTSIEIDLLELEDVPFSPSLLGYYIITAQKPSY